MGKKVERKYYNKDGSIYFLTAGNDMVGFFDKDNNCVGKCLQKLIDYYKVSYNGKVYLLRLFKRKGFCAVYKIENNDINISEPIIFKLPEVQSYNYVDLWEGLDIN